MRKILLFLLTAFFLLSCNNDKKTTDTTDKEAADDTAATAINKPSLPPEKTFEMVLGSYVGAFGDNKITLLVTRADKDSAAGRSIVGGNDRPFVGTLMKKDSSYIFNVKEPGDDPDDGIFSFTISAANTEVITGSWKPNDVKKKTKEYSLQRKNFVYNADAGSYPQASQRLLKPKDLENEMKEDLEFMRNEIFARHGFCFKKKYLRQQFENEAWYIPNTVDIKGFLTGIEKKNIELIKRYEKYADEYGDEYGR